MRPSWVRIWLIFVPAFCGCSAAKFYKAPVANFQSGVNQTASTVEPYFTELNRMESQYRLFEKVHDNKDWGAEDLRPRFSPQTIQVRVQALEVVKKYAKLLSDIAGSSAPDDFQKAADNLGRQTQSLEDTVGKLAGPRVPPIGEPLGKLVNFLGQIKIEHERKKALEVAITAGEGPINQLIEALRDDTAIAVDLWYEDLKQQEAILLGMYNAQRKSATSPDALEALMKKVLDSSGEAEALRNLPVRNLFDDFENAHNALVAFAKSGGRPSGVAGLAAQIDVFTQQAQSLSDFVLSLRNAK
jgi:hypothetical protein